MFSLAKPSSRLILAAFLMDFAIGVVGLGWQLMAVGMGAAPLVLGLIGTVGNITYTAGCLVSGRLSDRHGRRRSVFVACLLTGLAWAGYRFVSEPMQILFILPIAGWGIAFYWPPLQAWLGELSSGKRELNRDIGRFNMFWCWGLLSGPVVCGYLWPYGHALPFLTGIGTILVLLVIAWVTPRRMSAVVAGEELEVEAPHPHARLFLELAWIGNFAASVAVGAVKTLFPKLGDTLGFSPALVGWVIASLHFGQLMLFFVGGRTTRWHYRLGPMLGAPLLAAAGLVVACYATTALGFAVGFIAAGICAGVTYVTSLFYSLHNNTDDPGNKAGVHEAVLGLGILIGPLLGGVLAQRLDLRAPYWFAAGVMLYASALMLWHYRRTVRRHAS